MASMHRPRSLEAEKDLEHFLRIARPEWSGVRPRRGGKRGANNIARVIEKLRDIGVSDTEALVERIDNNTINDDLYKIGHVRFSRDAIESIRRQGPFIRSLESADVPHVRQVGVFAPVPQMLTKKRLLAGYRPQRSPRPLDSTLGSSSSCSRLVPACAEGGLTSGYSSDGFGRSQSTGALHLRGVLRTGRRRPRSPTSFSPRHELERESTCSASSSATGAVVGRLRSGTDVEELSASGCNDELLAASRVGGRLRNVTWSTASGTGSVGDVSPKVRMRRSHSCWSFGELSEAGDIQMPTAPPPRAPGESQADVRTRRSATAIWPMTEKAALDMDLPSLDELEKQHKMAIEMRRRNEGALWACHRYKTPLQQGEEMLREQLALDERTNLMRMVREQHGATPFRAHVANNIHQRLREEKQRDISEALVGERDKITIRQKCMKIRKHVGELVISRRELTCLRWKAQQSLAEDEEGSQGEEGSQDALDSARLAELSAAAGGLTPNHVSFAGKAGGSLSELPVKVKEGRSNSTKGSASFARRRATTH